MTRQVSVTSKEAFAAITPTLSERRQEVLDALEALGEATNNEIAFHMKRDINRVTGRITELRKLGLIELVGTRIGQYNVRNQVWKVADEKPAVLEQPSLIEMDCGEK